MKTHLALAMILALTFGTAAIAPSFAMDSGGTSDTTPKPKCKKGEVVKNGKCKPKNPGVLPDEDLFQQGRNLALSGEYDWAIGVLELVSNQKDPRVLTYIGYSHRKAGRFEEAFNYYNKALAIDPNSVLTREYLGEGYVAAGKIDLAKAQLSEIASRCGTTCEEYQELAEHIETGVN
ncbi:MAG: tetratricopeptide repeat protein [Parvibaculaceae bacterium]